MVVYAQQMHEQAFTIASKVGEAMSSLGYVSRCVTECSCAIREYRDMKI